MKKLNLSLPRLSWDQILEAGFQSATSGYHIVQNMTKDDPKLLEEFQNECKYFSQAREDNLKDMM